MITIESILAEIDALRARVAALAPQAATIPTPANDLIGDDLIPLAQAAKLARTAKLNVRRWALRHSLGHKVGGRWLISRSKLEAFVRAKAA